MKLHRPAIFSCLIITTIWVLGVGCSSGPGDQKTAYGPVSENTTYLFSRKDTNTPYQGGIIGTKEIKGTTYSRLVLSDSITAPQEGMESWILDKGDQKYEFIGGEVYSSVFGLGQPGQVMFTGTTNVKARVTARILYKVFSE